MEEIKEEVEQGAEMLKLKKASVPPPAPLAGDLPGGGSDPQAAGGEARQAATRNSLRPLRQHRQSRRRQPNPIGGGDKSDLNERERQDEVATNSRPGAMTSSSGRCPTKMVRHPTSSYLVAPTHPGATWFQLVAKSFLGGIPGRELGGGWRKPRRDYTARPPPFDPCRTVLSGTGILPDYRARVSLEVPLASITKIAINQVTGVCRPLVGDTGHDPPGATPRGLREKHKYHQRCLRWQARQVWPAGKWSVHYPFPCALRSPGTSPAHSFWAVLHLRRPPAHLNHDGGACMSELASVGIQYVWHGRRSDAGVTVGLGKAWCTNHATAAPSTDWCVPVARLFPMRALGGSYDSLHAVRFPSEHFQRTPPTVVGAGFNPMQRWGASWVVTFGGKLIWMIVSGLMAVVLQAVNAKSVHLYWTAGYLIPSPATTCQFKAGNTPYLSGLCLRCEAEALDYFLCEQIACPIISLFFDIPPQSHQYHHFYSVTGRLATFKIPSLVVT
ncbi:hypothetical protein QBC42DRAFT_247867 [Cladorrhinum samala]|uniref:Uncharacterized protein n=1 Tax=Cladorrhinum samala TaxID=585594 RepID=A0AAV9I5H0_9PEZI|nr:hypothetical protein QBC42DRAFT_247867 [Cladorrhinum samala]